MSTLAEIEEAIVRLPEGQVDRLAAWLEQRRAHREKTPAASKEKEPDFSARARKIWGEQPSGTPLSQLINESRG
ncbi:MAG: hypothetical protein ACKOKC_15050 [Chthoniobacterales bacterium]